MGPDLWCQHILPVVLKRNSQFKVSSLYYVYISNITVECLSLLLRILEFPETGYQFSPCFYLVLPEDWNKMWVAISQSCSLLLYAYLYIIEIVTINSMELSLSWVTNNRLVCRQIPNVIWNPKLHRCAARALHRNLSWAYECSPHPHAVFNWDAF
jgi:hypothetical protein